MFEHRASDDKHMASPSQYVTRTHTQTHTFQDFRQQEPGIPLLGLAVWHARFERLVAEIHESPHKPMISFTTDCHTPA